MARKKSGRQSTQAAQIAQVVEILKSLGANDPETLAKEEVRSGAPHSARYRFVRKAWSFAVDRKECDWIDQAIVFAEQHPNEPGAQAGRALKRMREKGISDAEITDLVRVMQHHMLHGVSFLLDFPNDVEPQIDGAQWALCALDEDGNPIEHIGGLYEITAELDPSGLGLRPEAALPPSTTAKVTKKAKSK
jgi:hypothetical protein